MSKELLAKLGTVPNIFSAIQIVLHGISLSIPLRPKSYTLDLKLESEESPPGARSSYIPSFDDWSSKHYLISQAALSDLVCDLDLPTTKAETSLITSRAMELFRKRS